MKLLIDYFGTSISIGDTIIHTVKRSCDVDIHYGFIYSVEQKQNGYALGVIMYKKLYSWETGNNPIYRTKLTARSFVKSDIPNDIKELLIQHLKY